MEKWHAAKPNSIVDGKPRTQLVEVRESDSPTAIAPERLEKPPAADAPPQYTQVFADAMVAEARARRAGDRDHRGDGGGDRPAEARRRAPRAATTTSASPSRTRSCSPPGWRSRARSRSARSTRPSSSAPTTRSIHDVCLQELDVTFAMDRAGLVGDDGPTHHGAFDISYFRPMPNVVADGAARRGDAGPHAAHRDRPRRARRRCATRAARRRGSRCRAGREEIPIGTGELLASGERVALLGYGYGVHGGAATPPRSSPATTSRPTVADARFAKPLDTELLERLALGHDLVVTIEENVLPGGFGSAVLEHLEDAFSDRPEERARLLRIGLPDRYVTHGKPALLREEVGLTGDSVAERVLAELRSGQPALR